MLLVVGAIVEADAGRAPTFAMASHARADTWLALRRTLRTSTSNLCSFDRR